MSQYPEKELDVDALQVGLDAAVEHLRRFKQTQADLAQARIERDNLQARIEELVLAHAEALRMQSANAEALRVQYDELRQTKALAQLQSELSESRQTIIELLRAQGYGGGGHA
jgi:hypothetical protein